MQVYRKSQILVLSRLVGSFIVAKTTCTVSAFYKGESQDYARLVDKDKAISWLERCFNEGVGMNFVKYDPSFDSLHSDPRYADLLRPLGLPQ